MRRNGYGDKDSSRNLSLVSTWKSGNQLFARVQNNNVSSVKLTASNLVWGEQTIQEYVNRQSFNPTGSPDKNIYYTGDDYDSPTSVTLIPATQILFGGGGTQYDMITTFGNVSSLTMSYSGSLTFGSCVVGFGLGLSLQGNEPSDGENPSGNEVAGAAVKGLARLVSSEPAAGLDLERLSDLLAQAGERVTAWLFRSSGSVPRSTARHPNNMTLTNPPAGQIWRSYYYAAGGRVAMRVQDPGGSYVFFLIGDHLGSTSVTTDQSGNVVATLLYKAWGEVRYSSGKMPTNYTYTGQYSYTADFGLMFYGARWYDSSLSRFAQADTIIPGAGDPAAFDRYAAMLNNPIQYTDPTGHYVPNPVQGCTLYFDDYTCAAGTADAKGKYGGLQGQQDDNQTLTENGEAVKKLYKKYRDTPGWWNNGTIGTMTLEQFLGLMLLYEMQYETGAKDLYVEAMARQIWMEAAGKGEKSTIYCSGSICENGAFNAMWTELQVVRARVGQATSGIPPFDYPPYYADSKGADKNLTKMLDDATEIGHKILHPEAAWKQTDRDAPYFFGNAAYNHKFYWNTAKRDEFNGLDNQKVLGPDSGAWYKNGWWDVNPDLTDAMGIFSLNQMQDYEP